MPAKMARYRNCMGTLGSCFKRGAPVIFTGKKEHMASLAVEVMAKMSDGKNREVRIDREGVTLEYTPNRMLEDIPGVGPELAISLLKYFGNVRRIANAKMKTLTSIDGIGNKIATNIKNAFNEEVK